MNKRVDPIIVPEGDEELRPGSIVQLVSGGMRMSVAKVAPEAIDVVWFAGSGELKTATLTPEVLLVLVPRAEPAPAPKAKPGEAGRGDV